MKYLLLIASLLIMAGCDHVQNVDPAGNGQTLGFSPNKPYVNNKNQTVIVIPWDTLKDWYNDHLNYKLITITGIGLSGYGVDNYFLVVYETPEALPEKTLKEQALEKLTPAEKQALGL